MAQSEGGRSETVEPLRKRKADGTLYLRPPDMERLLVGLMSIDEGELLARAAIRRRSAPGWLPGECLVHMMRRAGRNRDRRAYNRWCALVLERIGARLMQRPESSVPVANLERAEYALDRFVAMLGPDLEAYDERLDIWEARFDLALANLRRDAFRRAYSAEETDTVGIADDPAIIAEVERSVGSFDPFDPARLADEDFRFRTWAAIDALPTEQNRVIIMMHSGLPVGTGAEGQHSISGMLGTTPRTILNWKHKAYAAIRAAVEGDEL
ncbi:hypothetical protein NRB_14420 [Novosphingobium sp. 11B]